MPKQKKVEKSVLALVHRAISMAFSYFSSSLEAFHRYCSDELIRTNVLLNLEYAHSELEKAYRACIHVVEQNGKNNTANTIDFHNGGLARAVERTGITSLLWKDTWGSVEENGLAATIENVATDITDIADKVKKIEVLIRNQQGTRVTIAYAYYDLMGEINAVLRAASAVGLIADMADAIKSGRRDVYDIVIPLKGGDLMSNVASQRVAIA